jgi:TolB-like protein/DNA-binding SARP family transcriptional activator/Tfp pilus assembly protein PilF
VRVYWFRRVNGPCRPSEFTMNSSPTFYLRLFGSPSVEAESGTLLTGRVTQRHRVALLALLALAPAERSTRDKLIAYLWPESDPERGRNLLNVSTYVLRSTLGEEALLSAGDDLRVNADVIRTDVAEFETALEHGDYSRAVAVYKGPFLDGFFLSDAPEFEQWASKERERLSSLYGKALEALAEDAEARQNFSKAAEWWKTRAAQDPYDSRIAIHLMRALEAAGNRAGALQHAAVHQRLLEQEFGIATAPEVASFAERLRKASSTKSAGTGRGIEAAEQRAPESTAPSIEPQQLRLKTDAARAESTPSLAPDAFDRRSPRRRMTWVWIAGVAAVILVAVAVWLAWPGLSQPERSIAVLPFINLSGAADNEYFSDGLTEEIITGLSAVPDLKVISRTSAMHYKGTKEPLRQIAQELNVAHILEGSVRQSDGRVRISAQLIDAQSDEHLWAGNYDEELRDVFHVQEQIAREVVRALEIELGEQGGTALVRRGTSDPEAYDLYRRGRYLWNTRAREAHERAIEYYQRAIARDSSYADAYAGLADAYLTAYQLNLSTLPEAESYSRMKWAAERALALDDKSANAHTSFAISLQWQRNWPGAERELRRAIQLNPGNATARSWYAMLLSGVGSSRQALDESRRAYELDPFAVVVSGNYAWLRYLAGDSDGAIEQYRRTLEIGPSYGWAYERLALAYAQKGNFDEATRVLQKGIELSPRGPDFGADIAYVEALNGETAAARETLQRAKRQPFEPFNIARAYVALHQPDSAFKWLEQSSWQWPHRAVRIDPGLDPLRADPRFARLSAGIEREMGIR